MNIETFGDYIRNASEVKNLPLRKVASHLDIDTSVLSKIERNKRVATKEILPTLAKTLEVQIKEIEFIKAFFLLDFGELKFLKNGLEETLNSINSCK